MDVALEEMMLSINKKFLAKTSFFVGYFFVLNLVNTDNWIFYRFLSSLVHRQYKITTTN